MRPQRSDLAALVLPLLGTLFVATGRDDSFITYWPARTLADTGEIVNYNGERIEQSSSLLHTVLLALADVLTPLDVPTLGHLSGIVGGIVCVILAGRIGGELRPRGALPAAVAVATAGYLVYWSFGGLETTIAAAALTVAVWTGARFVDGTASAPMAGLTIGLAVAARPETQFVLLAAWVGLAVAIGIRAIPATARHPNAFGRAVGMAGVVVGSAAVLALFRLWYFGQPVPQPVESKVGGLEIGRGLDYLDRWAWRPEVLALVVVAGVGLWRCRRDASVVPALLALAAVAQLGFVVTSGGDWMEAGRFLVPLVALLAPFVGAAVADVRGVGLHRVAVGAVAFVGLGGTFWVADTWSTGTPLWATVAPEALVPTGRGALPAPYARNRVNARDIEFAEQFVPAVRALADHVDRPVRVASGQAGLVVHELRRYLGDDIEFVDLASLATDEFDVPGCHDGVVRSAQGSGISFRWWVEHRVTCAVPLPDVFFGLGRPEAMGAAVLAEYVVLVEQGPGMLRAQGPGPAGLAVPYGEYAIVRAELFFSR